MEITVIYGPAASGKTFNAETFAQHYGCKRIVDGYTIHDRSPTVENGDLVLTTDDRKSLARTLRGARLISITAARQDCGLEQAL